MVAGMGSWPGSLWFVPSENVGAAVLGTPFG